MRRSLTEDEFKRLLKSTAEGPGIQRIPPSDRVIIYIVACYTGFRKKEIGSITARSFNFANSPATLTIQAGYSKRRRLDIIPLRRDFAEIIYRWFQSNRSLDDHVPLFNIDRKRTAEMLRKDLERAGIPFMDKDGQYVDFHALRTTFITNLSRAGVSPKTAQSRARLSDINLTMNTYTKLTVFDQVAGVEALPPLPSVNGQPDSIQDIKATGTEDPVANQIAVPTMVPKMVPYAPRQMSCRLHRFAL